MRESERILRRNDYLRDARILQGLSRRKVRRRRGHRRHMALKPRSGSAARAAEHHRVRHRREEPSSARSGHLAVRSTSDVDRHLAVRRVGDSSVAGSRWQVGALVAANSDGYAQVRDVGRTSMHSHEMVGRSPSSQRETLDSVYDYGAVVEQFETREREATVGGWRRSIDRGQPLERWSDLRRAPRWRAGVANPGAILPADRRLLYPWVGAEVVEDDFRVTQQSRPDRCEPKTCHGLAGEGFAWAPRPGPRSDRNALSMT